MIDIQNLSKSFGQLQVLKDINLTIQEKEVLVLIGSSGSGKSTLLRCLNFLEDAQGGQISIDGEAIHPKKNRLK